VAPAMTATQFPPRGTADAVRTARPALGECLREGRITDLLVLFGDTPLLRSETIAALLATRRRAPAAAVAVAGFRPADPALYGSLVLGPHSDLLRFVEARDAVFPERKMGLCRGGIRAIAARRAFDLVDRIGNGNAKREFYLTDIVSIAREQGLECRY